MVTTRQPPYNEHTIVNLLQPLPPWKGAAISMDAQRILLLQGLVQGPGKVKETVESLPTEAVHFRPDGGGWSAHKVVAHLANLEPLFLARLERILREEDPFLRSLGPDQVSAYSAASLEELVNAYRVGRRVILNLLYPLQPEEWQRPAYHERQGSTDMMGQVYTLIKHDRVHMGQLIDLCYAWEQMGANQPPPGIRSPSELLISEEANHAP